MFIENKAAAERASGKTKRKKNPVPIIIRIVNKMETWKEEIISSRKKGTDNGSVEQITKID